MADEFLIEKNIILLLTGTINPINKHFTSFVDPVKRKFDYINTIQYYLENFNYPIVFVENSNEDISSSFKTAIQENRLEILYFDGNNYPQEYGKGFGEMACIEHGIEHSIKINDNSFIFKITGRYKITNLKMFIQFYKEHANAELIADLTNNFKHSQSGIFGCKSFFARNFLFKYKSILNDTKGMYFEHALAKAVLLAISENIIFYIFRYYPKIEAISGTTGTPYKNSRIYFLPRNLKYFLRYFIIMR